MFHCPNCRLPLARHRAATGVFWSCIGCDGRVATVDFLRNSADHEAVNELWHAVREPLLASLRICPSCERAMGIAIATLRGWTVPIDACVTCQCVWFDRGEIDRLGKRAPAPARGLSPRASEAVARVEVAGASADAYDDSDAPVEPWQSVLASFGFPVLIDRSTAVGRPWLALAFVATASFVGIVELTTSAGLAARCGFPNADSFAAWCGSFVASAWVPAGAWQLVLELYILAVFGGEVELALGRPRFAGFALLAIAAGHAGFLLLDPPPDVLHLGAAPLATACVVFFALCFPHARVHAAAPGALGGRAWIPAVSLPAALWLALWLLVTLVPAVTSRARPGAAAAVAGGALGAAVGLLVRRLGRPRGSAPWLSIGPR